MIERDPQVSVIIAAFNSAVYLPETLESIFAQTYPSYEIILVDDGSTDDTPEIAYRYRNHIRYFRQSNSGGPARPRNNWIAPAEGKFVCIFDSDDIMISDKLARSVDFIRSYPDLGLIFSNFVTFEDHGPQPETHLDTCANFSRLPKEFLGPARYRIKSSIAFDALFYENYIGTSSVLIPAAVLKVIGPFDEDVSRGGLEDRDMWFRITRQYDIGFLNFVGHRYRVRANSVSKRVIESAQARIKVIRRLSKPALRATIKARARAVVAKCFFDIGYQYLVNGQLSTARRYFRKSFCQLLSRAAARGFLLTLLGSRLLRVLRCF